MFPRSVHGNQLVRIYIIDVKDACRRRDKPPKMFCNEVGAILDAHTCCQGPCELKKSQHLIAACGDLFKPSDTRLNIDRNWNRGGSNRPQRGWRGWGDDLRADCRI